MNDHKGFFAMMARMKYIERWALMRNSVSENICEPVSYTHLTLPTTSRV